MNSVLKGDQKLDGTTLLPPAWTVPESRELAFGGARRINRYVCRTAGGCARETTCLLRGPGVDNKR